MLRTNCAIKRKCLKFTSMLGGTPTAVAKMCNLSMDAGRTWGAREDGKYPKFTSMLGGMPTAGAKMYKLAMDAGEICLQKSTKEAAGPITERNAAKPQLWSVREPPPDRPQRKKR